MGFGQACARESFYDCKRKDTDQLSTCADWTVPQLFTHLNVESTFILLLYVKNFNMFQDVHNYIVFARYVVYVFLSGG